VTKRQGVEQKKLKKAGGPTRNAANENLRRDEGRRPVEGKSLIKGQYKRKIKGEKKRGGPYTLRNIFGNKDI